MSAFDFDKRILFENERAIIRPLQGNDLVHLLPIALQDPTLLQYSPSQIHNEKHLKEYISHAVKARVNHDRYPFIIFDKKSQQYAGSTSFGNISNKDKRLEIGWTWIGRAFQGSGLNAACKAMMLDYTFRVLEFERVEFRIDSRNTRSRKAVEKLGATFEGELRSHTVMSNGFRRNTVYYSILRGEVG